ncbi:ABC transporter permease [Paenibacillus radicis (ex Gao et al. 2016)]|uniref:ABC transporter involved in multi-copper enzyme maturation permease n=1 Tax=Paenibacillus radicis (ex Gao et al. 2016) TaxID=1737354 RepID=A0A917HJY3_9BACL|nr:ABC transporter permease subunit [Paenibacillus radicis (ex Gao et al. 2016)]GGG81563.1 ABC transporter involved in multi-copper enzyme maturation permease [Paenibacillus radicis (ex Gao et al. 2016)]
MNAVWRLTLKEMLRKRVTLMTIVMTALFLIAFWFVSDAIIGDRKPNVNEFASFGHLFERFRDGAIILSLGYFFGAFAVAFLAIFSSVAAVSGEAEHGVLQSVLARPIKRWKWYLGRWLGFNVFGIVYALIVFIAIQCVTWLQTGIQLEMAVLFKSFLLYASVVPLLISLTMLGSCWLSSLGNGVAMTMLFGMGWLGSMISRVSDTGQISEEGVKSLSTITGLITLIMPADSLQQRMLAEMFSIHEFANSLHGNSFMMLFAVNNPPSNTFLIYSAAYTVVVLLAGLLVITRKDF